jgi:peroxiredoxin Q/BCP
MRRYVALGLLAGALATGNAAPAAAQDAGANLLAVGEMAPDFELVGATRHGVLAEPVRLSDYRGETVVLAFFFRVRTRG